MQQAARISDKTAFFLLGKLVEYDETCKEFAILRLFMQAPGIVQTREHLLAEVWGQSFLGESRTVDMHKKTLRQKLGAAGGCITTVIGVGCRALLCAGSAAVFVLDNL